MKSPEILQNMPRTRTMFAVILLIILAATITCTLVVHFFSQQPDLTQAEASYIIFTDGVTAYARNGVTGEIQFRGNDSSAVINSALGNTQGVVFVSKGNYTITSSIVMNTGNSLVGEGWETILNANKNLNASVIVNYYLNGKGATNDKLQVANLEINGANITGLSNSFGRIVSPNGIEWANVFDSSITGVYIYDCGAEGISLWDCRSTVIQNNVLLRNGYYMNVSGNVRASGLFADAENCSSNAYNIIITNNHATRNGMDGINVYNARSVVINDNIAEFNEEDGIYVAQSIRTTVVGNTVNDNGWNNASFNANLVNGADGITVENSSDVTVSGNVAFHNGCVSNRTGICPAGDGIAVGRGLQVSITGNSANFNYGHGINLVGSCYSTVSGNVVRDNNCSGTYCSLPYTLDGIHLSQEYVPDLNKTYACLFNVITGNIASDDQAKHTQGWGIAEYWDARANATVPVDWNLIASNTCTGNLIGGMKVIGNSTKVADSYNGTTWTP